MSIKGRPESGVPVAVIDILFLILLLSQAVPGQTIAEEEGRGGMAGRDLPEYDWDDDDFLGKEVATVYDPLEPVNRIFFQFNDKLYFWLFKPVARTYGEVVPLEFRLSFRNCYNNLMSPVVITNDFLQGKFGDSFLEVCRFVINSTVGILGLTDAAKDVFELNSPSDEDLGQTMGYYGLGNGVYFCLPFLGPSTLRDTVGTAGDVFLRPGMYAFSDIDSSVRGAFFLGKHINNTSLRIGEYEDFLQATLDPYLAMRDAYIQRRLKMSKE